MEYLNLPIEVKADKEARTIEGLGSVFHNIDGGRDVVLPGAFAKSIASGRSVRMLWQHKSDHVVGKWDEIRETGEGLYLKGRILNTTLGNDTYELVKEGAVSGLSIGYGVKDSSLDRKTGVRQLKELTLHEVSIVTFPMNELATITRVKGKPEDERQLEEYLREVGYTQGEAKGIIAKGYKAIAGQREVEGHALDGLFNILTNAKM